MCKPSRRASYTANPRGTKFRNYRHMRSNRSWRSMRQSCPIPFKYCLPFIHHRQSPVRQTYSPHMRVPRPHLAPPIPLDSISLLSSPPTGPRGDWCPTALSHSLAASLGVAIQSACSTAPRRRTSCLIFPPAPPVRRFPHEGWSSWSALRCGARWTIKQPVSASSTML